MSVNLVSIADNVFNHSVSYVTVSDISFCHLDEVQEAQLRQVLQRFADVLSDVPKKTHFAEHFIRIKDGVPPVAQAHYRLNPEKLKIVDKEIQDLLAKEIEKSYSTWAAPFGSKTGWVKAILH